MNRFLLLSAVALSAASAYAAGDITVKKCEANFLPEAISPNGKWVTGGQYTWNVETDALITNEEDTFSLKNVNDNGTAVGNAENYAFSMDAEGSISYINGLEQYSLAKGISADGSLIVGSTFDKSWITNACYWMNGQLHPLTIPEEIEDVDLNGILGWRAIGVSEDGSVIAGNLMSGMDAGGVVVWQRNAEGEYEFKSMFDGLMEYGWEEVKPYIMMSAECISPNGKWIGLHLQMNDWDDWTLYTGRLNVETGEMVKAEGFGDESIGSYFPSAISNDGTIIGFTEVKESSMFGRQSVIWPADSDNLQYLTEYYNEDADVMELAEGEAMVATGISADNSKVSGFAILDGVTTPFVIDRTISTAVETVSSENINSSKVVYDLQGNRVNGQLKSGLYIIVENGQSQKVMIK